MSCTAGWDVMAEAADGGGGDEEEALATESKWHGARDHRVIAEIPENTNRLLSARIRVQIEGKARWQQQQYTRQMAAACASWHVCSVCFGECHDLERVYGVKNVADDDDDDLLY